MQIWEMAARAPEKLERTLLSVGTIGILCKQLREFTTITTYFENAVTTHEYESIVCYSPNQIPFSGVTNSRSLREMNWSA